MYRLLGLQSPSRSSVEFAIEAFVCDPSCLYLLCYDDSQSISAVVEEDVWESLLLGAINVSLSFGSIPV